MTRPLDPVDQGVVKTWFNAVDEEPTAEVFEAVRAHRAMFSYLASALVRDLPVSFERDAALARLREAWHWTATCILQHGPS